MSYIRMIKIDTELLRIMLLFFKFDSRIALWYSDGSFTQSVSGGSLWKSTVIPHLHMYMTS